MGILKKLRRVDERKEQYKAYLKEGNKFSSSNDPESAVESYTKAIEMKMCGDQPDYNMHYERGCTYETMKEMEKAAEDFKVFLLADDRELAVSYSIAGMGQALSAFSRGMKQARARFRLTEQTLQKVFSAYDFDVGYSNKKLYDWGSPYNASKKLQKDNVQEANYRMGVIRLLQGKYKEAHQHLEKAISIDPKDARLYFFRGITHVFQSRKGGIFGPSRNARELSKTKAISDFERAIALTKDHALIEQANKWKINVTSK